MSEGRETSWGSHTEQSHPRTIFAFLPPGQKEASMLRYSLILFLPALLEMPAATTYAASPATFSKVIAADVSQGEPRISDGLEVDGTQTVASSEFFSPDNPLGHFWQLQQNQLIEFRFDVPDDATKVAVEITALGLPDGADDMVVRLNEGELQTPSAPPPKQFRIKTLSSSSTDSLKPFVKGKNVVKIGATEDVVGVQMVKVIVTRPRPVFSWGTGENRRSVTILSPSVDQVVSTNTEQLDIDWHAEGFEEGEAIRLMYWRSGGPWLQIPGAYGLPPSHGATTTHRGHFTWSVNSSLKPGDISIAVRPYVLKTQKNYLLSGTILPHPDAIRLSPNHRFVALAHARHLRLVDVSTNDEILVHDYGNSTIIKALAFSRDSRRIAIAVERLAVSDETKPTYIEVRKLPTGRRVASVESKQKLLDTRRVGVLSPTYFRLGDDDTVIFATRKNPSRAGLLDVVNAWHWQDDDIGTVKWPLQDVGSEESEEMSLRLRALNYLPGRVWVSGHPENADEVSLPITVAPFSPGRGTFHGAIELHLRRFEVILSPQDRYLLVGGESTIQMYNVFGEDHKTLQVNEWLTYDAIFSSDGRSVLLFGKNLQRDAAELRVYETEMGQLVGTSSSDDITLRRSSGTFWATAKLAGLSRSGRFAFLVTPMRKADGSLGGRLRKMRMPPADGE